MTIVNAAGDEVYNGKLGLVENLLPGAYTVTIYYFDGEELGSKTVDVLPGETTSADFGKLTVTKLGETEIFCDWDH